MMKNRIYQPKRDVLKSAIIKKVSIKAGVSTSYVRMVLRMERENDYIMALYMGFLESDNLLMTAVETLVPFN